VPISPFMDRQKANLPQSQVGFLDFLVIPMFTSWVKFLDLPDRICPLMDQLKANKEHWKSQLEVVPSTSTGAGASTNGAAPRSSRGSVGQTSVPGAVVDEPQQQKDRGGGEEKKEQH
jgi:hypothetical protein